MSLSAGKGPPTQASVVDYLPLVQRLARRMSRRLPPHVSFEDLVGAGVVGLLEAMQRFDPQRATDFSSYAEFRIRGAMLDELRRDDMMARDARSAAKQIEQTMHRLNRDLGRVAQEQEVAEALGLDVETLRTRLERLVPVRITTFDESLGEGDRSNSPLEQASRQEMRMLLAESISHLTERQQQVLHLYYREELTLKEIGFVLDVSESRICQILAGITLQLRVLVHRGADERKRGHDV